MSTSAPPSRAAITRNSTSDAHQHRLRSGFHNILPSLSVAGTILEEGEETDEYTSSGASLHHGSRGSEHALYSSAGAAVYNSGGGASNSPHAARGQVPYATASAGHDGLPPMLPPVDTASGMHPIPQPQRAARSPGRLASGDSDTWSPAGPVSYTHLTLPTTPYV